MLSRFQSKSGADAIALDLPGMDLVAGAIDSHVHCCPHINARTVTVFDAVRQAARARMRAIGLMDVFADTSGLAALACRELGDTGVEVFGGVILEPYVGGLAVASSSCAVDGLWPGDGRALCLPAVPSHQVRGAFRRPRPSLRPRLPRNSRRRRTAGASSGDHRPLYCSGRRLQTATCRRRRLCGWFRRPGGAAPSAFWSLPRIWTAIRPRRSPRKAPIRVRFLRHEPCHSGRSDHDRQGTAPVLTGAALAVAETIRRVGPDRVVLSSDSGSYVLPPPVEAFRELMVMIRSEGFDDDAIRLMTVHNTARLFKVGEGFKRFDELPRATSEGS